LGDGVDLAFGQTRGAERCAIVEVGAPIPVAIPAMLFEVAAQLLASRWQRSTKGASPRRLATSAKRISTW
jgi:hypothetical protein